MARHMMHLVRMVARKGAATWAEAVGASTGLYMPSGSGWMTPPLAKRDPTELKNAAAALFTAGAAAG